VRGRLRNPASGQCQAKHWAERAGHCWSLVTHLSSVCPTLLHPSLTTYSSVLGLKWVFVVRLFSIVYSFFIFIFAVLGMEPRVSCTPSKHSTTGSPPAPTVKIFLIDTELYIFMGHRVIFQYKYIVLNDLIGLIGISIVSKTSHFFVLGTFRI
jgi:hypothetical protein